MLSVKTLQNPFFFQKVSNSILYKLIKNINANNTMGCDLIPPTLEKTAVDQLSELTNIIIIIAVD